MAQRNTLRKFKCIPFVWEGQNYLVKIKSDTHFLCSSPFSLYFNFSNKSDTFLVFPSMKQSSIVPTGPSRRKIMEKASAKTVIPLPNTLMKLIR
jgi:hypothetical protein